MSTLKEVTESLRAFQDACHKHARFGAVDSEPTRHFFHLCRKAAEGGDPQVPMTAKGWELYHGMAGSEEVAMEMYQKASLVISQIRDCPISQLRAVRAML